MKIIVRSTVVNYALFVAGLIKRYADPKQDYLHGAIGISKEAGEMLDNAYRAWNYNKPRTAETDANIVEEAGDILFYLQAQLAQVGSTIEQALEANVEKLWNRYPEGYSDEAALARADKVPSQ